MKVVGKRIVKTNEETGDMTPNGTKGYEVMRILEQEEEDVTEGITHMGMLIYDDDPNTVIATVSTKYEYVDEEDKEMELDGQPLGTIELAKEINDDYKKDYKKFKEEEASMEGQPEDQELFEEQKLEKS